MATPPPIIRSSKAFSVEIPEGSNSAKSRRSDIVGNNDLDIHRKSSQFHEAGSDTLKSPDFHTDDGADARSVSDTSTDHTDKIHNETAADEDRYAVENSHALSENLQGFDQSQSPVNLIAVDENAQKEDNRQVLQDEAYRDRQAHGESGHALQDRFGTETNAPLKDRALSVEAQGLSSNVQGIAQDALHNNQQSIDNEALHARKDTQAKAHVQDHVVALPDTHQVLKPGPSPLAVNPHAGQRPGVADHAPTAPQLEADPQHAALSKAEKAKRMEEFHGRVEAIRKSVSGINHLLDDLQDKP